MFCLRPDIRLREATGSFWAFNVDDGRHYELNETAFFILAAMARGAAADEIVTALAEEYGVDTEEAAKDLAELLEYAREQQMIEEG